MTERGQARTSDDVDIYYESTGTGRPIVFVHGLGDTGATFARVVADLQRRFRCVVIDLRGHGQSGSARDYDALGLERDIAAAAGHPHANRARELSAQNAVAEKPANETKHRTTLVGLRRYAIEPHVCDAVVSKARAIRASSAGQQLFVPIVFVAVQR